MDDTGDPLSFILLNTSVSFYISFVIMAVLLVCSALISGSEVAFFSLSPSDTSELEKSESGSHKLIYQLLQRPKRLLATILIGNNLVNVGIIILSTFITNDILTFAASPALTFTLQVVVVTFLILLVGEIMPKVYANRNALKLAGFMAYPLFFMEKMFRPLSVVLVRSTSFIDKRIKKKGNNISVDELSHALELTNDEETTHEEQKILQGIVKFGNTDVKQIMKSRIDVVAFDIETDFKELLPSLLEAGYSRIPIYRESFDNIEGILYIKDLLPHYEKEKVQWNKLLRQPMFVPENKKIDDLLREFQEQKMHMAIVVDEYGGSSGIVTLEDILEEIVGDITDEFDDDDLIYSKLDDNNFVFEGKTPLNDMYRVLEVDGSNFEDAKGDSDTIAGFIIELAGKIPLKNERFNFENLEFTVEAADKRRVKRIKVTVHQPEEKADEQQ